MHTYWTDVQCFGMPHLINAIVALIGLLVFVPMSIAVQTATCDLNPVAKGVMASSDARNKIRVGGWRLGRHPPGLVHAAASQPASSAIRAPAFLLLRW